MFQLNGHGQTVSVRGLFAFILRVVLAILAPHILGIAIGQVAEALAGCDTFDNLFQFRVGLEACHGVQYPAREIQRNPHHGEDIYVHATEGEEADNCLGDGFERAGDTGGESRVVRGAQKQQIVKQASDTYHNQEGEHEAKVPQLKGSQRNVNFPKHKAGCQEERKCVVAVEM